MSGDAGTGGEAGNGTSHGNSSHSSAVDLLYPKRDEGKYTSFMVAPFRGLKEMLYADPLAAGKAARKEGSSTLDDLATYYAGSATGYAAAQLPKAFIQEYTAPYLGASVSDVTWNPYVMQFIGPQLEGGSGLSMLGTSLLPYVATVPAGVYLMYKGIENKNMYQVVAGVGISTLPLWNILGDIAVSTSKILGYSGTSVGLATPVAAIVLGGLAAGAIYKIGKGLVRPLLKKGEGQHQEAAHGQNETAAASA